MSDQLGRSKNTKKWAWILVLVLLAIGAAVWFARPLRDAAKEEPSRPAAQSTEWTPEPEGSAVPVNLPKTPMTNAPVDDKGEAPEADKDAERP
jgi:hypothetical protein